MTNKVPLRIILLIVILLLIPYELAFANSSNELSWNCQKSKNNNWENEQCNLYAYSINHPPVLIFKGNKDIMYHSVIRYYSFNLAELRTSCGTACSTSIFFNFKTNQTSPSIDAVLAVNYQHQLAVIVNQEGIKLIPIFGNTTNGKVIIKRADLSADSAIISDAVDQANFVKDKLYINYYDTKDKLIKKIIPISPEA